MTRFARYFVLCVLAALPASALAHPISTYYFKLTETGSSYADTFKINSSATPVDGSTISPAFSGTSGWTTDIVANGTDEGAFTFLVGNFTGQAAVLFYPIAGLYFDTPSDLNTFYTGGGTATAFTLGTYDFNNSVDQYQIQVADTPFATTPEPSSLALLGTGLLAFAGVARRRFLHT